MSVLQVLVIVLRVPMVVRHVNSKMELILVLVLDVLGMVGIVPMVAEISLAQKIKFNEDDRLE